MTTDIADAPPQHPPRIPFRQHGNDLYCDVECNCIDPSWAGSAVAHLFHRKVKLTGYNDDNFFRNVNAAPRTVQCKCGRVLLYQWFTDGVEVSWMGQAPTEPTIEDYCRATAQTVLQLVGSDHQRMSAALAREFATRPRLAGDGWYSFAMPDGLTSIPLRVEFRAGAYLYVGELFSAMAGQTVSYMVSLQPHRPLDPEHRMCATRGCPQPATVHGHCSDHWCAQVERERERAEALR